jgi:mannitol-1-phosphate/altronate dehydrogenase
MIKKMTTQQKYTILSLLSAAWLRYRKAGDNIRAQKMDKEHSRIYATLTDAEKSAYWQINKN